MRWIVTSLFGSADLRALECQSGEILYGICNKTLSRWIATRFYPIKSYQYFRCGQDARGGKPEGTSSADLTLPSPNRYEVCRVRTILLDHIYNTEGALLHLSLMVKQLRCQGLLKYGMHC